MNKKLLNRALYLLAKRDFSEQELRNKLKIFALDLYKKANDPTSISPIVINDSIDEVIQYCYKHRWLDDSEYITKYINYQSRRGYGPNKISHDLIQKGLSPELVTFIIQGCDINWDMIASSILKKKFASNRVDIQTSLELKQKSKMYRFLMSRGFSNEQMNKLIEYVYHY